MPTLRVAGLATALVFLAACEKVGPLSERSETVGMEGATAARIDLSMNAGELYLEGGALDLLEADFAYNVARWEPEITHQPGPEARVQIRQGGGSGRISGRTRNQWDIRLTPDLPLRLDIEMGAGRAEIDLRGLEVARLDLDVGAGDLDLDLTGRRESDMEVDLDGGVGRAVLRLPDEVGVRVDVDTGIGSVRTDGLTRRGEWYVNDAYGDSDVTVTVRIDAGIGSIVLEVSG